MKRRAAQASAPGAHATLRFLYDLQLFGIKAGLRNIRALLASLGHPEEGFASVHIAGTNGKGSTASMIASVLTAAGYRTGLYTSPHLRRFAERIRIDGRPIAEADIVRLTRRMRPAIERTQATFFEATTAMAFAFFAEAQVDIAVIETGLGGRLDATNAVRPALAVITGIGFDHTERLGATIARIACEKAGIIKRRVPIITGALEPAAARVIRARARAVGAPLVNAAPARADLITEESLSGLRVRIDHPLVPGGSLAISLAGAHQARNARVALEALAGLRPRFGRITAHAVAGGFADIRRFSGLRGRIDTLRRSPTIVADVGHNPEGVRTLVAALRRVIVGKAVVVFGVMREKEYQAMAEALAPVARCVVAVRPETERALDCAAIVDAFHARGRRAIAGGRVALGLEIALDELRAGETLLVAGSHYVVGEAMDALEVPSRALPRAQARAGRK